ncbi:alanine racemase [Paenibacillus eucommiae]|uniref:Alanine racemase n=1 Tax=Paenibacillus eucommiae TaxID=1355755 RepID=A0ABS4INN4_9BACL|nr:alanine racemase [Paenibacillus eucommiae]MBP1989128.1 alanine racemase [Paenibacillus eucommiae]
MNTFSYRNTWVEISLDAIYQNAAMFKAKLSESCLLMAVVKADGYGHGAEEVARSAIQAGANYLGVAFLEEALQLRKAGIEHPILLLGYTPPHAVEAAVKHHITITVGSDAELQQLIACTEQLGMQARTHLKVDSGMSRLGLTTFDEAQALCEKAAGSRFVKLEGLFTHFATAESEDSSFTDQQFQFFTSLIEHLEKHQIHIPIKHCCNSAGTINFPHMHLDMVRIGISLYGLLPSGADSHPAYPLQPAMSLKSEISSIRSVAKQQSVSYGRTFQTMKTSQIATLPIGYADGVPRLLSNIGSVLIRGQRVPIAGRICMDQMMLDVTGLPDVQIGDEVTLIGRCGELSISSNEIAALTHSINYEVVCSIGKRVPRVYTQNGHPMKIKGHLI